jgi:hypothetical protein
MRFVIYIFKRENWQSHVYIVIYTFPIFMLDPDILQLKHRHY